MSGIKASNEYLDYIGADLYQRTPKAVLGAVVASLLSGGGDNPAAVPDALIDEWEILHANGIVPQKPPCAPPHPAAPRPTPQETP